MMTATAYDETIAAELEAAVSIGLIRSGGLVTADLDAPQVTTPIQLDPMLPGGYYPDQCWQLPDPPNPHLGDMNGDGVLNNQDISAFLLALSDQPAWQAAYPQVNLLESGDINGDGYFNNQDISPFITLLGGGSLGPSLLDSGLLMSLESVYASLREGRRDAGQFLDQLTMAKAAEAQAWAAQYAVAQQQVSDWQTSLAETQDAFTAELAAAQYQLEGELEQNEQWAWNIFTQAENDLQAGKRDVLALTEHLQNQNALDIANASLSLSIKAKQIQACQAAMSLVASVRTEAMDQIQVASRLALANQMSELDTKWKQTFDAQTHILIHDQDPTTSWGQMRSIYASNYAYFVVRPDLALKEVGGAVMDGVKWVFSPEGIGVQQGAIGLVMMVTGGAMVWTGVGTPVGLLLIARGADYVYTGILTWKTGEIQPTLLHQGVAGTLTWAGVSPGAAYWIATGVEFLFDMGLTGSASQVRVDQATRIIAARTKTVSTAARNVSDTKNTAALQSHIHRPAQYVSSGAKADIKAANRKIYDAFTESGGKIVRQRNRDVFDSAGRQIFGEYDAVANEIRLYSGSNMETLSHELIHFSQAQRMTGEGGIGIGFPTRLVSYYERQVQVVLKQWGYVK